MGTRQTMGRVTAFSLAAALAALGASAARAAQISGSVGSVMLVGNDGNPSGSFTVQVDYSVYNGQDASDPLGNDGFDNIAGNLDDDYLQLVFQMTHLGSGGEVPVLNVGRLTVFAPNISDPVPFYKNITALAQMGTQAPSFMDIDPPPSSPLVNRGEFFFEDMLTNPLFAPGMVSHLLVLTTPASGLPADVVIEVNHTQPQVHADTTIRLVPEPGAASLLLLGMAAVLRRRR